MNEAVFYFSLFALSLSELAEACCSGKDVQQQCVQTVAEYARPTTPSCFFDPFENDQVVNRQTVSYTWEQARNVCLSLNATLPLLTSSYATLMLRNAYYHRGRFWLGVQRNTSTGTHQFVDLPRNTSGMNLSWTNWGKYEPNNAGCYENCAYMNYDGTWNDYACDFIPIWDRCSDVIHTICQETGNPNCLFSFQPKPIPLAEDWYVILAITFGGIIGVVTLIVSLRFIVLQCSELRK